MRLRSIIIIIIVAVFSCTFIANICFAKNTGIITTETANLRKEANTSSSILELLSAGEKVEIIESSNGWTKVKHNNITGYVRSDLISTNSSIAENSTDTGNSEPTNTVSSNNTVNANTVTSNSTESNSNSATNSEADNGVVSSSSSNETTDNSTDSTSTGSENSINTSSDTTTKNASVVALGQNNVKEKTTLKIIPLINGMDVNTVEANTEVEVTEVINNWAKIKTADNKEGWIIVEKLAIIQGSENLTNVEQAQITEISQEQNEQTQQENTETTEAENTETTEQTIQTSKKMYVNVQVANVREQASSSAKMLTQLNLNTEVTVKSTENGWSQIEVNGKTGYILSSLLSETKSADSTSRSALNDIEKVGTDNTIKQSSSNPSKATGNKETSSSSSTTATTNTSVDTTVASSVASSTTSADAIIAYAKQYLGCKYIMGGTSPSGFDCSGFTQYVYKHFGIGINRTAAAQYSNGKQVTDLQAGDLVMFGPNGISHVGIYIGGGTFIHAANPSKGVTTDTLLSGYYKTHYVGARRIL